MTCLGDPDPAARDDFAYARLVEALRSEGFPPGLARRTYHNLLSLFGDGGGDLAAVRRPFVILTFAEIARYDRLAPLLTPDERRAMARRAAMYLKTITDYRGFVPGEGWRHGVAHGADLIMQLALHPDLHADDSAMMLDAVAVQAAPPGTHSYIHGESGRLARPVLFLAASGKVSDEQLTGFFARLKPDASPRWTNAYGSLEGLAALHNTRAFAMTLLVESLRSKDPNVKRLESPLMELLRALP